MTLEPKNIILAIFLVVNIIFLIAKKDVINVALGLFLSFILLIWYGSEVIPSQQTFYDFTICFTMILLTMIAILSRMSNDNKKDGELSKSRKFSVNKASLAVLGFAGFLFLAIFLILKSPATNSNLANDEKMITEMDVGNVKIATEDQVPSQAALGEKSIFVDLFMSLGKVIVVTILFYCFLIVLSVKKEIFFDK